MAVAIKYVAYYRVSTRKQQASGLGLDAQNASVAAHVRNGRLVGEFTEVESGKNNARPQLAAALALAKLHKAILVVAKLDRLSRSVSFLSELLDSGVEVVCCDNPHATKFNLHILASVAEFEAAAISERTRNALKAAKTRGIRLGGWKGRQFSEADCERASEARTARADERASQLAPVIRELQAKGVTTLLGIADALNSMDVPTALGGKWYARSIANVLARL